MSKINKAAKASDKIIDALGLDEVTKWLRSIKGESDDAVQTLGSGKNLEALQNAKVNAPDMNQIDLPKQTTFQPGVGDAPLKTPINPDDLNVPASSYDDLEPLSIKRPQNQFEAPMKRPEPVMSKEAAPSLGETADELQGTMDNLLDPNRKKKNIATGVAAAGLGAGTLMMGGEEEKAKSGLLESMLISSAPALINSVMGSDEPELPRSPATESPMGLPSQQPVEKANTTEDDFVKMMREAQSRQGELDFIDNMLRAGITTGSAIAGTKADYSGVDALQKQNAKGVNDVKGLMSADMDSKKLKKVQAELEDDKKMRDPNSDVSKAFKQALAKLGIKHTEKTTAQDAKKMGINIQNLLMQEKQMELTDKKADAKSKKDVDGFVTGAQKMLQKPFQQYQKVANARNSLKGYLSGEPSGPQDVAILYDFIKGLDPESAVREGEISLGQSAMSMFEKYGIKARNITSGEILSPKFRKAIAQIMDAKETQAKDNYQQLANPFIFEAAKRGIPEEDYARFDYLSASGRKEQKTQDTKSSGPKETVQLGSPKKPGSTIRSGGQTFIVNPDGKTATEQ